MNGASRRKSTELLHVTLSTGDIRTSPLVDGYRLTASETGELLAFEIWPRPELDSLPLVRCTVARPGEGGAAAWSRLRPQAPEPVRPRLPGRLPAPGCPAAARPGARSRRGRLVGRRGAVRCLVLAAAGKAARVNGDAWSDLLPAIARHLLGDPPAIEADGFWRYGKRGSLAVHVDGPQRGTFRAGESVGERLHRKLQRQTQGRTPQRGDLHDVGGGKGVDGGLLTGHVDRQALAGELVDYRQELQGPPIPGPIKYEVVRPHVVAIRRSEPDTGTVTEPQPTERLGGSLPTLERPRNLNGYFVLGRKDGTGVERPLLTQRSSTTCALNFLRSSSV